MCFKKKAIFVVKGVLKSTSNNKDAAAGFDIPNHYHQIIFAWGKQQLFTKLTLFTTTTIRVACTFLW